MPAEQQRVREVIDVVEVGVGAFDVGGDLPVVSGEDLLDQIVEDCCAARLRSVLYGYSFVGLDGEWLTY